MENDSLNKFPAYPVDHDSKSLSHVEVQLRSRLLVEQQMGIVVEPEQRRINKSGASDVRLNISMPLSEFFPHGKFYPPGQLHGFTATLDRDTFRVYLNRPDSIAIVLYINTLTKICLATRLLF